MNIFKVSCYSDCHSYFGSYLQSVTVIADTEQDALQVVKDWMKKTGEGFIYEEERIVKSKKVTYPDYRNTFNKNPVEVEEVTTKRWQVDLVVKDIQNNTVIDTFTDSDY